jgi:hypothetical protein
MIIYIYIDIVYNNHHYYPSCLTKLILLSFVNVVLLLASTIGTNIYKLLNTPVTCQTENILKSLKHGSTNLVIIKKV